MMAGKDEACSRNFHSSSWVDGTSCEPLLVIQYITAPNARGAKLGP